jgi:hypothetical protein
LPKIHLQWQNKGAIELVSLGFAALGLVVFLITLQLKLSPEIQAYINLPSDFFYLAIIVLLILHLEGELGRGYVALLWFVLIPLRALIGLAQGALGFAIIETAALLITYATMRRRIPWLIFIAGFGAFFFMQPIKGMMRSMVFAGRTANTEQNQSDKFEALVVTGAQGVTAVENLPLGDLLSIATNRLADIMVLATVVNLTPEDIPYWGGTTFYRLLLVPVPRLIYPEKPVDLPGNVLGHQYGMISGDDYTTSINLMQILELYGNFGPFGVVLGSIVIGMIYRTINDLFISRACGLGAVVAGIYIFMHLVDIENAASSVFGGLLIESLTVMAFHCGIRLAEGFFAVTSSRGLLQARVSGAGATMAEGGAAGRS